MPEKRKKDGQTKTYFRSERMVKENSEWYFTTREGDIHGPYPTREIAQGELDEYVKIMIDDGEGRLTVAPRMYHIT